MRLAARLAAKLAMAVLGCAALAPAQPKPQRQPQSGVDAPRLGTMLDSHGALRGVWGVAGSFITGQAENQNVTAFACADQGCATSGPESPAVIASDGRIAVEYIAETGQFLRWTLRGRTARQRLEWTTNGGEVLSIHLTPEGAEIAFRRDAVVWIVSQDGATLGALPDEAHGPVLLIDRGAVYATDQEVVLLRRDGTQSRYALPEAHAFYTMSAEWVEIVADGGIYALRTASGRERFYALPETAP